MTSERCVLIFQFRVLLKNKLIIYKNQNKLKQDHLGKPSLAE